MGTPLGPKYIPYTYMDPLGFMSIIFAYDSALLGVMSQTSTWSSKVGRVPGFRV